MNQPFDPMPSKTFKLVDQDGREITLTTTSSAPAATCPHCGQSLAGLGGTYASGDGSGTPLPPFDASVERVSPPTKTYESWRDREPLL